MEDFKRTLNVNAVYKILEITQKNVFTARNSKSQTCVEIGLLNIKTLFFLYLTEEYPVLFS